MRKCNVPRSGYVVVRHLRTSCVPVIPTQLYLLSTTYLLGSSYLFSSTPTPPRPSSYVALYKSSQASAHYHCGASIAVATRPSPPW